MNTGDQGVNLSAPHGRIHRGQFFTGSEFNTIAAGVGNTIIYLISTHDSAAHFNFDISTDGDVNVSLLKQVTASVIGTVVPAVNANDFSDVESSTVLTTEATLTDEGSLWECLMLIGGPGQSRSSQVSGSRIEEFIMKVNDFYALKVENFGNQEINVCVRTGWYEPEV